MKGKTTLKSETLPNVDLTVVSSEPVVIWLSSMKDSSPVKMLATVHIGFQDSCMYTIKFQYYKAQPICTVTNASASINACKCRVHEE